MTPRLWQRLCQTLLALVATLFCAYVLFGFLYWWAEDYRLIESLHWSMQTISTTGYGDVPPKTDQGLVLAQMLQPMALVLTALFFANFVKRAIPEVNVFTEEEQMEVLEYVRRKQREDGFATKEVGIQ